MAAVRSATVLPDDRVTFSLSAPQAGQVMLNFQNKVGPSPAADAIPMTEDANGLWSVTVGPLAPNLYGYGFIVDGAKIRGVATSATSHRCSSADMTMAMARGRTPHASPGRESFRCAPTCLPPVSDASREVWRRARPGRTATAPYDKGNGSCTV